MERRKVFLQIQSRGEYHEKRIIDKNGSKKTEWIFLFLAILHHLNSCNVFGVSSNYEEGWARTIDRKMYLNKNKLSQRIEMLIVHFFNLETKFIIHIMYIRKKKQSFAT